MKKNEFHLLRQTQSHSEMNTRIASTNHHTTNQSQQGI